MGNGALYMEDELKFVCVINHKKCKYFHEGMEWNYCLTPSWKGCSFKYRK